MISRAGGIGLKGNIKNGANIRIAQPERYRDHSLFPGGLRWDKSETSLRRTGKRATGRSDRGEDSGRYRFVERCFRFVKRQCREAYSYEGLDELGMWNC